MPTPSCPLRPLLAILSLAVGLFAGCSGSATVGSAPPGPVSGSLSYSPQPILAGQQITVSGTVLNLVSGDEPATWSALRDGITTVADGTLHGTADGGPVPLSFHDSIPNPGDHNYAVTIVAPSGSTRLLLNVPVAYLLVPGIQLVNQTSTTCVLSLTMTNSGVGAIAVAVPASITDSNGMVIFTALSFDFATTPLGPGSSMSQTVTVGIPASGNDTYTFTIDPNGTLGSNLAGQPATDSLPIGLG